ncbi:MAG: endolytic transglycosylase MltG [Smithellaceae bacterium]|nr:endolytic transglycosylase MltG [Smithellaceae bacterium]
MGKNTNRRHTALLAMLILSLALLIITFINYSLSPVDRGVKTKLVDIPKGTGFLDIVDILQKEGMISNRPYFSVLAVTMGSSRHIKAGEYELAGSMNPVEIINKLVRGDTKVYHVTIREDLNLREIAAILMELKLAKSETFFRLSSDHEFLKSLGIEGKTLEGYLYPDTYEFDRSMTTKEIIGIMVNQFWRKVTPEMLKRAKQLGMTQTEFLTLASMIGKESGFKDEKTLISAVFHNRLKRGMRLQSDPTAVYDIADFGGLIRKSHLKRTSPHNTYYIKGLPPGPIANPGIDSLQAALYPADVNYLYFVSNNNGSHYFSSTLAEHNQAVLRYQIAKKK